MWVFVGLELEELACASLSVAGLLGTKFGPSATLDHSIADTHPNVGACSVVQPQLMAKSTNEMLVGHMECH